MSKLYSKTNTYYFVILFVLFSSSAFAQLSVTPSRIEAKVPPGKSFEQDVVLKNMTDKSTTVDIAWRSRTRDALVDDWLQIDKNVLDLQAGEEGSVKVSVTIPEGATGEYNAWFVLSEGEPQKIEGFGANVAIRTSIPIYVAVSGTEQYDFEVKDVAITNRKSFELNLKIHNTGNVHIRPTGTVYITSLGTEVEYSVPFNEIMWGIIANQQHDYITKLGDDVVLEDGAYKAVIHIEAGDAERNLKEWDSEIIFDIEGNVGKVTRGFMESVEQEVK